MTVAVIILALALAYALFVLGALGKFDQAAAVVWEDVTAIPSSLAAGLRALASLALLFAFAAIFLAAPLVAAFGRWLWSRHPGTRIRRGWRRNKRGGRHVAAEARA